MQVDARRGKHRGEGNSRQSALWWKRLVSNLAAAPKNSCKYTELTGIGMQLSCFHGRSPVLGGRFLISYRIKSLFSRRFARTQAEGFSFMNSPPQLTLNVWESAAIFGNM